MYQCVVSGTTAFERIPRMGYNADSEDDANEDGLLEVVQASAFLELGGEWLL